MALGDGDGDSSGVGLGVSVGLGESEGDGLGVGEDFFRVGRGLSSSSGVGVGEAFFFFGRGVSSSSGVAEVRALRLLFASGDALGLGDGGGLLFRFFRRWLGVGVGVVKKFLIFFPNVGSSARTGGEGKMRTASAIAATRHAVVRPERPRFRFVMTIWERQQRIGGM